MRSNAVIAFAVLIAFSADIWADICGYCLQETLLNGCCYNPLCHASIFFGRCTHGSRISMEHDYAIVPANFRVTSVERHEGLTDRNDLKAMEIEKNPPEASPPNPKSNIPPAEITSLFDWFSSQTTNLTLHDIDHWYIQQHYMQVNIILDNALPDIAAQLFSSQQLLVITLSYQGGQELLFLQANDHGQVFGFSDQEDFLEEVQLIHNVMNLLTTTYEQFDPDSDSIQLRSYLFIQGKPADR